ncbi:MAG: hypothetical protein JOY66_19630 [Acetobacteraceae bacterium]|nr:hypothetical protein [Acetobacteraceae bacterium]
MRLPSKCGWLLRFGWQAAGSRCQFEHWLEDPEVKALVAASPQARRILRALCRMFGIPLGPALALPRRKRERPRKPDGGATGAAEGSAGIAPRAAATGKPTPAEIRSWYPGQKRPMPWSRSFARNEPRLIRPKPKMP